MCIFKCCKDNSVKWISVATELPPIGKTVLLRFNLESYAIRYGYLQGFFRRTKNNEEVSLWAEANFNAQGTTYTFCGDRPTHWMDIKALLEIDKE